MATCTFTEVSKRQNNSFALQMKPSNNDKNFLIMYSHVDNDNVYKLLHSWPFYM